MNLIYNKEGGGKGQEQKRQRYKEERGILWFKMAETQGS